MADLQVAIITPEETVLDQSAEFVSLPLVDGEMGILPGHAPMIGRIGFGELRIRHPKSSGRFFVDGGFVQVGNDQVSVLTSRAVPVGELNAAEIRQRLAAAESESGMSSGELAGRQDAINRARAQLRMLEKS